MIVTGEITSSTSVDVSKKDRDMTKDRDMDRGLGFETTLLPQSFFYIKPPMGCNKGTTNNSYSSPWYPQLSVQSSPSPPIQDSRLNNINSHYYMELHPVLPSLPRQPVYSFSGTIQDAWYGTMFPKSSQSPGVSPQNPYFPNH